MRGQLHKGKAVLKWHLLTVGDGFERGAVCPSLHRVVDHFHRSHACPPIASPPPLHHTTRAVSSTRPPPRQSRSNANARAADAEEVNILRFGNGWSHIRNVDSKQLSRSSYASRTRVPHASLVV
eukprot:1188331-Prorocentrum_minimum.AAC.2